MGGGKCRKYYSKENKHCNVISVNKTRNKRHDLINGRFFGSNIHEILIKDLVRNQHTYLQNKRLSLHNERLSLQSEQS
jgi:hypothetical protein